MATKKSTTKKAVKEKSASYKIGGKIGHLAIELLAGKDKIVEMAGEAIESVKSVIENIAVKKEGAPKKAAKPVVKKSATKSLVAAAKKTVKAAASKKAVPPKKATKAAPVKKAAPAKKAGKAVAAKKAAPVKAVRRR